VARKPHEFKITEVPGDKYKSLKEAWKAVLPALAQILADEVRLMLREGSIVNVHGEIVSPEMVPEAEKRAAELMAAEVGMP